MGEYFLLFCGRHFLFFRCLLTICFTCLIHQSIRNSMRIAAIPWDRRRCGDSCRNPIFRWQGEWLLLLCCRHSLFFRCLLTHCCTCLIHQSFRNSMRTTTIALERRRCGDSVRKATFCAEVSTFCRSVAVTFYSFDAFSPIVAPVSYINLSGIRCGWRQCLWSGSGVASRFVRRFLLTWWVILQSVLLLSLFVLSMPSHPLLHLYDTSIYQEFDADCNDAIGLVVE